MNDLDQRGSILRREFLHAAVLLPGGLGAGMLAWGVASGRPLLFGALGILSIAVAGTIFAVRAMFRFDRMMTSTVRDQVDQWLNTGHEGVDRLRGQVALRGEARVRAQVDALGRLARRLRQLPAAAANEPAREVKAKMTELLDSCAAWMDRAEAHRRTAEQLATETARQRVLAERERLLTEVDQSIERLGAAMDEVQLAGLSKDSGQLSRVRDELDLGLEVARRVQQRMAELEDGLQGNERKPELES